MKHVLNEVCVRLFAALLLTLSILVQHGIAEQPDNKEQPMTQTQPRYYYLDIKVKYIPAVFEINGFPTDTNTDDTGFETTTYLNNWLKPEKNTIRIIIDEPSEEAYKLGIPSLKATLGRAEYGQLIPNFDTDPVLTYFEWPNEEEPTVYPKVFEFEFDQIQDAHTVRTNLWDEAEPIAELTDEDKSDILMLVDSLRTKIESHAPPEEIFMLVEYRYRDDARARGNNFESLKSVIFEQYEWLAQLETLQSQPLSIEDAHFNIVGDNHAVQVMRGNNKFTIEIKEIDESNEETGRVIAIPITVAKIEGKWTIVR